MAGASTANVANTRCSKHNAGAHSSSVKSCCSTGREEWAVGLVVEHHDLVSPKAMNCLAVDTRSRYMGYPDGSSNLDWNAESSKSAGKSKCTYNCREYIHTAGLGLAYTIVGVVVLEALLVHDEVHSNVYSRVPPHAPVYAVHCAETDIAISPVGENSIVESQ